MLYEIIQSDKSCEWETKSLVSDSKIIKADIKIRIWLEGICRLPCRWTQTTGNWKKGQRNRLVGWEASKEISRQGCPASKQAGKEGMMQPGVNADLTSLRVAVWVMDADVLTIVRAGPSTWKPVISILISVLSTARTQDTNWCHIITSYHIVQPSSA